MIAIGAVEVYGRAPGRVVAVGQVRPEPSHIATFWAEVVIHHVQQDGQRLGMAGVDEPLETIGAAVVGMKAAYRSTPSYPPPARAGELINRHQFDMRHAQIYQMVQFPDDAVECALGGEGAHVKLVNDPRLQGRRPPVLVMPHEGAVAHAARQAVYARWLPA